MRNAGARPNKQPVSTEVPSVSEGEHPAIDADAVDSWKRDRRQCRQAPQQQGRHPDAEPTARDAQQRALGEHLPHQPGASGAKGGAHRHLARSRDRARQQQIRNVRTGDQQHETDGPQQHHQRRANWAGDRIGERLDSHLARGIVVGIGFGELTPDRVQIGDSLSVADSGPDLADRLEVLAAAACERLADVVAERRPHLRALVEALGDERLELTWHDPDDLERLTAHLDLPADGRWVSAKAAAPQTVAQDHDAVPVRRVVGCLEIAAARRARAKHREELPADAKRGHAFGRAVRDERRQPRSNRDERLERAGAVGIVFQSGEADVAGRPDGIAIADHEQAIPVRIR